MPTTIENLLADRVGRSVAAGDIVEVEIDFMFGHEFTFPPAVEEFRKIDVETVSDPERIAVIPDHITPAHAEFAVDLYNRCKEFANEHDTLFFQQGSQGQEHVLVPEQGLIKPGDVVLAADSHTCTHGAIGAFGAGIGSTDLAYAMAFGELWIKVPETTRVEYEGSPGEWVSGKDLVLATLGELGIDGAVSHVVEYGGQAIEELSMDDRFTVANMTVEMGGATGFVDFDGRTRRYVEERVEEDYSVHNPDSDATYTNEVAIDCDEMEPQVARPSRPSNVAPVSEVQSEGIEIDQAVIGSCTNGREGDLRTAAAILEGEEVANGVRLIVTPGTQHLEQLCIDEGLTSTFLAAGATMENPGCGACFGRRTGALGENEVAVSTTNRNVQGRMGDQSSEVYLASPAVTAASAVTGEITHPEVVI